MLLERKVSTMHPELNHDLMDRIVAFLRNIGLEVQAEAIAGDTILPGIQVDRGVLVYDSTRLQFPGDLLHEAGHLAVKSAADRKLAGFDLGGDPAEEMMAISWSYAAILHLQLPPEVVFHPAGGYYLAVPMLQWLGLTYAEKHAQEIGAVPYPKMKSWLRQS